MKKDYVHGYSEREAIRLVNQAETLASLLHDDTSYPGDSLVLEAGCGVGAQTIHLARNSPQAKITSVDISKPSLTHAKALMDRQGISNVQFQIAEAMPCRRAAGRTARFISSSDSPTGLAAR